MWWHFGISSNGNRVIHWAPLQNFIAIAIFIGDGLYNFLKIGILSLQASDADPSALSCMSLKQAHSMTVGI